MMRHIESGNLRWIFTASWAARQCSDSLLALSYQRRVANMFGMSVLCTRSRSCFHRMLLVDWVLRNKAIKWKSRINQKLTQDEIRTRKKVAMSCNHHLIRVLRYADLICHRTSSCSFEIYFFCCIFTTRYSFHLIDCTWWSGWSCYLNVGEKDHNNQFSTNGSSDNMQSGQTSKTLISCTISTHASFSFSGLIDNTKLMEHKIDEEIKCGKWTNTK